MQVRMGRQKIANHLTLVRRQIVQNDVDLPRRRPFDHLCEELHKLLAGVAGGGLAEHSDGAMADYNHAIELDPQYAIAYNNRGNIKLAKGDLNGAMADYNHAIELNPNIALAYNNRGLVKFREVDFDGAIREYNRAIQLDSNYGLAYRNRGNAKRKKGDLNGAIDDYNRAIKLGVTTE